MERSSYKSFKRATDHRISDIEKSDLIGGIGGFSCLMNLVEALMLHVVELNLAVSSRA